MTRISLNAQLPHTDLDRFSLEGAVAVITHETFLIEALYAVSQCGIWIGWIILALNLFCEKIVARRPIRTSLNGVIATDISTLCHC